jgi:hypothetical protein
MDMGAFVEVWATGKNMNGQNENGENCIFHRAIIEPD